MCVSLPPIALILIICRNCYKLADVFSSCQDSCTGYHVDRIVSELCVRESFAVLHESGKSMTGMQWKSVVTNTWELQQNGYAEH